MVTTNTVEPAFSLFKRGIVGTWNGVAIDHLISSMGAFTNISASVPATDEELGPTVEAPIFAPWLLKIDK